MFIIDFFKWLFQLIFGKRKPGKVKHFKAELIDMSNVRVSWALPTVSSRQKPIQHTEISVRVDPSLPWTVQDNVVPSDPQELVFVDVAPGTQFYQAIVVDVDGKRGSPVATSVDVPFDPPGSVSGFSAVIE